MALKWEALLFDNRISEQARVIGMWISRQKPGEGGHTELRFDEVRKALYGFPADDTIRRHLRMLEGSGWVHREKGGRGHADRFRLCQDAGLSGDAEKFTPAPEPSLKDRPALNPSLNTGRTDRPAPEPSLNPRARVLDEKYVDGGVARARAREELEPKIRRLVDADLLAGCRDSLADYLVARVGSAFRHGYVRSVQGWMNGTEPVFKHSGYTVPEGDRASVLAAALNDLSQSDETKMRRDPGDIGNLRTKLSILVGKRARNAGNNDPGPGSEGRSQTSRSSIAAGQGTHDFE